eukprot:SM000141S00912  [mRNA]  locus=s141:216533:219525:- [translate_table: standard]
MTSSRPVLAVASLLLLAAVAALADSEVQHAPAVLFLDDGNNGDGVFLRADDKSSEQMADLTPQAFAAAIAALLASHIPFSNSTTALQVDALLAPDIFKRPEAVIVAVVAGMDQATKFCAASILQEESQRGADDAQSSQVGGPDLIDLMQVVDTELDLMKETDQEYVSELSCFYKSAEDEVLRATTSNTSLTTPQPVLISGLITTLQALRTKHGTKSSKYQGAAKLVIDVLVHSLRSLRTAYEGQLVGALVLLGNIEDEEASLLKNSAQLVRVARKLQDSSLSSVRSRRFVNKTIAILTGLILFVAALLGVYALLYMPLIRDPLLYSGAKVD